MSEDLYKTLEIGSESKEQESSKGLIEETKYPALRVISAIYKVLAIIMGIAAFIAFIYGLTQLGEGYRARETGTTIIIASLAYGFIAVIAFLAVAEMIKLFIDLESNSRKQITLLNRILDKK